MKTTLDHLSPQHQEELKKITGIIKDKVPVDMVVLFGSFARGDWVSDRYTEGHITYEYQSDFDLLIVVRNKKLEKNFSAWNDIEKEILEDPEIEIPVNIVTDTIHFVNKRILEGNYFYTDIKKEGVVLYDSHDFKLSEPKALTPKEKKDLAERDYSFWVGKSESFLKDFNHNMKDAEWNNAAFHLHQVTEALFVAALLVFTGYKPKTHNIAKIEKMVGEEMPELAKIFPKNTAEDKHLFDLLVRAYVDARYRADYVITKEELEKLGERVLTLKKAVKKACEEKINSIV